jgi:hypothetical protein
VGKNIDELRGQMDERPLEPSEAAAEQVKEDTKGKDVRSATWYGFVVDIEDLRGSGEVAWAEETLAGIQETVERTHRVTEGQQRAIDNIAAKRQAPRSGGRRYEGFNRGR